MSDVTTAAGEAAHHHHHEEVEKVETISSTTTPWGVRLGFGIAGLVLLVGAFVAWQFRDTMDGHLAQVLPWIIAGAIVLGAGAIMESITTEIWLVVIAGAFALAITFLIVGRVAIYPSVGQSMFVVDRFSGDVQLCTADGCKPLAKVAAFPVKAPVIAPVPATPAVQAAPAAQPAPVVPAAPAVKPASAPAMKATAPVRK